MALALTIPGVVDSQDLHSLHPEPDGVSFAVTFDYNDTATAGGDSGSRNRAVEMPSPGIVFHIRREKRRILPRKS